MADAIRHADLPAKPVRGRVDRQTRGDKDIGDQLAGHRVGVAAAVGPDGGAARVRRIHRVPIFRGRRRSGGGSGAQEGGHLRAEHGRRHGVLRLRSREHGRQRVPGDRAERVRVVRVADVEVVLAESDEVLERAVDVPIGDVEQVDLHRVADGVPKVDRQHARRRAAVLPVAGGGHQLLEALAVFAGEDTLRKGLALQRSRRCVHEHAGELGRVVLEGEVRIQVDDRITHHVQQRQDGGQLATAELGLHLPGDAGLHEGLT
mmetsp:Transcript_61063/g.176913  ORF Transcript_61063/g.176913 Transcript_61063/m.176913 type:complete len:261 (+) Transcript_61063:496-1278(+)